MILSAGDKIKVRDQYVVYLNNSIYQGGEVIQITSSMIPELERQEWKFSVIDPIRPVINASDGSGGTKGSSDGDESGDEEKDSMSDVVANRAILSKKDTKRARLTKK